MVVSNHILELGDLGTVRNRDIRDDVGKPMRDEIGMLASFRPQFRQTLRKCLVDRGGDFLFLATSSRRRTHVARLLIRISRESGRVFLMQRLGPLRPHSS